MDSFQVMEFLMELEESFDIMIDVNSLSNAHTVKDLAKVVSDLLEE
jgi:acyl carrier protein